MGYGVDTLKDRVTLLVTGAITSDGHSVSLICHFSAGILSILAPFNKRIGPFSANVYIYFTKI